MKTMYVLQFFRMDWNLDYECHLIDVAIDILVSDDNQKIYDYVKENWLKLITTYANNNKPISDVNRFRIFNFYDNTFVIKGDEDESETYCYFKIEEVEAL